MKAFIVYTPDIKELAEECRDRVLRFTNIKAVELLAADTRFAAHRMKLEAWQWFGGPTWVVDADLWFLQSCILPVPDGPVIFGNPDNSPITKEKYWGTVVEIGHAINTSLVGADCSNEKMQGAILEAMSLQADRYGESPVTDEKFFNEAISKQPLVIARLSTRFNWCGINPPARTFAVHAASEPDKLQWLREAVQNYERNTTAPDP